MGTIQPEMHLSRACGALYAIYVTRKRFVAPQGGIFLFGFPATLGFVPPATYAKACKATGETGLVIWSI